MPIHQLDEGKSVQNGPEIVADLEVGEAELPVDEGGLDPAEIGSQGLEKSDSDAVDLAEDGTHREEKAVRILGGKIEEQKEFMLPGSDIYRCLVYIRKELAASSSISTTTAA